MSKPSLGVVYGQPDRLSTSFQTRCLAEALSSHFEVQHHRVPLTERQTFQQLARLRKNAVHLRLRPPAADYVLYCNDGFFDLRRVRGFKLLYWYDAPTDWANFPPARWQVVDHIRYTNVVTADFVFAVSQAQVSLARKLRPEGFGCVTYLPVGVNCVEFSPERADAEAAKRTYKVPENKVVIGYLGRLGVTGERYAGQALLEAARKIAAKVDAHFLIVGDGPALSLFQRDVAALELQDRFTFTGFVPQKVLSSCIAAMDVCVDTLEPGFHSEARSETKLKQYMAMGRACVATNIGENCVDLAGGACGVLCEPGSESLCGAIVDLCRDAERRKQLGRSARKRAELFYDWQRLAGRLLTAIGQG
ncbi:MAG TPA: glycosyltransferase [Bryobacteraceae bacterium]|nr:glycosyltransferase [Bryobacteraceae bacterium]